MSQYFTILYEHSTRKAKVELDLIRNCIQSKSDSMHTLWVSKKMSPK